MKQAIGTGWLTVGNCIRVLSAASDHEAVPSGSGKEVGIPCLALALYTGPSVKEQGWLRCSVVNWKMDKKKPRIDRGGLPRASPEHEEMRGLAVHIKCINYIDNHMGSQDLLDVWAGVVKLNASAKANLNPANV